eukprot:549006_1
MVIEPLMTLLNTLKKKQMKKMNESTDNLLKMTAEQLEQITYHNHTTNGHVPTNNDNEDHKDENKEKEEFADEEEDLVEYIIDTEDDKDENKESDKEIDPKQAKRERKRKFIENEIV